MRRIRKSAVNTVASIKCLIALKVPRQALIFKRIWLDPSSRVGRSRYTEPVSLIYRRYSWLSVFLWSVSCEFRWIVIENLRVSNAERDKTMLRVSVFTISIYQWRRIGCERASFGRLVKFWYSYKFFVFYNLISCSIVNLSQEYFWC